MNGTIFRLCIVPILYLLLILFFVSREGIGIVTGETAGFAELWWLIPIMLALVGGTFLSHFEKGVPNAASWFAIFVGGAIVIAVFASLHQASGVLCTAPVCVKSDLYPIDTLFLYGLAGTSPPEGPGSKSDELVAIDNQFSSALYFSTVTFTTLGYGDYQPMPRMRLVAASQAVFGYLYLGMFVGGLIDLGRVNSDARKDDKISKAKPLFSGTPQPVKKSAQDNANHENNSADATDGD